jgi:GDP-D-mannose dehydratase
VPTAQRKCCRLDLISLNPSSLQIVYQAGSSEMFGSAEHLPIDEQTPICPRTPYGTSKASAYWILQNYRNMYDMYAVTAILFNQESDRRRPHNPVHFAIRLS